jgi:uncharacterized protein (TIGR00369 family)
LSGLVSKARTIYEVIRRKERRMLGSIFDKFRTPPAAALLGWRLIDLDLEARRITVGFEAKPEFLNPGGNVQGGILAAMLDDGMGPVVVAVTNGEFMGTTTDLHVSYMRPVKPGTISVVGEITNIGKQFVFLEGKLFDASGKLCARATASSLLVKIDQRES